MKRFVKVLSVGLCVSMVTFFVSIPVLAEPAESMLMPFQDGTEKPDILMASSYELPAYSVKGSVLVNGQENTLYATFDDAAGALESFKTQWSDYLNKVASTYGVGSLTVENWEVFYGYALQYMAETADFSDAQAMDAFSRFIDIYENQKKNDEIMALLESRTVIDSSELAIILPYTSPAYEEYQNNRVQLQPRSGFNVSAGVEYAAKYARNHNDYLHYYYFSNGDCANFASQILEAGGVQQEVYDSEYMGWWHKFLVLHTHSQSWTMADVWARYQGIYAKTSSLNTFSGSLQDGDFIGFDKERDGDIDHIGFVTFLGTYNTYNGKYYRDFAVAQHTGDYYAWVSWDENGWDNLDGAVDYVRLRRS